MPRLKNTHELFKSHRKEVFPADFLIITIWHDQESMLESGVSVWNSVSQRWDLLWICSLPRTSPDFPSGGLWVKQAPAGALAGSCLQKGAGCPPWPSCCLPSPGIEGVRREGEMGHLILSVLCLILSTLSASLLMPVCFHYLTLLPHEKYKAYWANK